MSQCREYGEYTNYGCVIIISFIYSSDHLIDASSFTKHKISMMMASAKGVATTAMEMGMVGRDNVIF